MAITAQQVQELYIAYLGRPADQAGLTYWLAELNAEPAVLTLEDLRANFVNEQPEYASIYGGLSTAQVVAKIYQNLFDREGEAEGLAYWTGEVVNGNVPLDQLLVAFLNAASPADKAVVDQKVADAMAGLPVDPTDPVEPGNPGQTFALTDGRDTLVGTAGDDTFVGFVGQNQDGSLANAFATGDYIDGGAGRDKIVVTLQQDKQVDDGANVAINARTVNVEEIYVEALNDVTVDAGRMDSIQQYWSDNSSGDLLYTDVRLGSKLGITKDITFGLRETDFATDFTARLDSQSFRAAPESASNAQLLVRIADVSTETPATPLANVSLNLNFKLGGQLVSLNNIVSVDGTYAGLQAALSSALAAAGQGSVVVSLSNPYNQVTVAGNTVNLPFVANEILLTDPNGNAFTDINFTQSAIAPVADGFLVAGNATPVDPSVTGNLIESNVVLDNAGRGSLAGDVLIGAMSESNKGIEQFNVIVDRNSQIESLTTTKNKLQNIIITSQGADGSLVIRGTQDNLVEIDANAFEGPALTLGWLNADGTVNTTINDLAFLDAGNTAADVTFVGNNDGGLAAVLNTGSGNDLFVVYQDGISASGSTPTSLTINAGSGNNVVTLSSDNFDGIDNTATVITGAGVDVITGGANSLTVNSGAGNDVIYAENTGDKTEATLAAGAYVTEVGTSAAAQNGTVINNIDLLDGREVRVTLGLPGMVANEFVHGLEVTATIKASSGFLTTERDLYNAVRDAINNDAVLNKLAKASVDSLGNLNVDYLVDGVTLGGDAIVNIDVLAGNFAGLGVNAQNSLVNALKAKYSDSQITGADIAGSYNTAYEETANVVTVGSDSLATGGTNTVTAGLGNDVVVLSSDDALIDTLVFEAGQFGNDTVVHFNAGIGGDVLDFTAWLNNVTSISGSVDSQIRIDTALDADQVIVANEVVVVTSNLLGLNDAQFAALTGAQLLAILNAPGGYSVGAAAAASFVGTTQKSIFMIEHTALDVTQNGNEGLYKVFEVSSTTVAGDGNFTAVTLVGSLDFAETQGLVIDNFA